MAVLRRNPFVLAFSLALIGAVAFWVTSAVADDPEKPMLPVAGVVAACGPDSPPEHAEDPNYHVGNFDGLGTFQERSIGEPTQIMAEVGQSFLSKRGLKTVPLTVVSMGGRAFAEGVGETRFWLDATRPVTSAIWEKQAGTEFPAVQEMRFHIFYTLEAFPGRVFRSINPTVMRSDNVRAFPPPPGTVYKLVKPVELEDVTQPGIVVGRLLSNRVVIPKPRLDRERQPEVH